jgi:hypothetical protein
MKVTSIVTAIAVALLLVACAADSDEDGAEFDCAKSFCGCSSGMTMPVTLRMSDANRNPVAGARLICHDDGSFLGTTDSDGLLTIEVAGSSSPGCGFIPDCQVAYFRTEEEQFGRHFWFARFVLGEDVSARAHAVERVDGTD